MKTASSQLLLLDVNVLLAIAWPNHQFHSAAIAALSRRNRWATCALPQLGSVRLSSNPAVVGPAKSPQQAVALLADLVGDPLHVYLDSLPAPTSGEWRSAFAGLFRHQQVTDAYLLQVAATHHAALLTFDRKLESLANSTARVVVLG
ncbi:TA system VapC family ribonuclease toxin [Paludibaculum fermentans]|uniref:Ribonuclease VapC n=1 Tax=Paludibaculum fermentans TaxID=1473598 RepID=A0A7S7SLR3_PALFE|nr:TA system VapC family ribonuclease toxin [Paludibaculum fermentans]QOY88315.1 VapC toxin family PIN domain ribonuclease [Paludibaculum fermentans]